MRLTLSARVHGIKESLMISDRKESGMEFLQRYVIEQIDFGTLAVLFCLMGVVAGFNELGYIDLLSQRLVACARSAKMLFVTLVLLCFFISMLVTNDVALIIMVPFTIQMLHNLEQHKKLIKVVVLETIAANLGSMLTPIGNPQNVYLYQYYQMHPAQFFGTIAPYALLSLITLLFVLGFDRGSSEVQVNMKRQQSRQDVKGKGIKTVVYSFLLVLSLLTVLGLAGHLFTFLVVAVVLACCNYRLFYQINYSLLFKFCILFLFVGNMADVEWISRKLQHIVSGNEFLCGVLLSQLLSNVPTALMLSRFTKAGTLLLQGVNVGGLGTLIASMASMISLEYYKKTAGADMKKYVKSFTGYNILFLIILVFLWLIIR